jgi:hypothetical protein
MPDAALGFPTGRPGGGTKWCARDSRFDSPRASGAMRGLARRECPRSRRTRGIPIPVEITEESQDLRSHEGPQKVDSERSMARSAESQTNILKIILLKYSCITSRSSHLLLDSLLYLSVSPRELSCLRLRVSSLVFVLCASAWAPSIETEQARGAPYRGITSARPRSARFFPILVRFTGLGHADLLALGG